MMNKARKRILTMALAVIMALSSLSGAFPTAFADEDASDGIVTVEEPTEEPTGEPGEEPSEEPAEEPAEEPTEEPTEEPSEEPGEEPTEVEPEPESTDEYAELDAVVIISNETAVRLTTDEKVVELEAKPELRLWSEEEEEEYGALLEGIEGEILAKLALYDIESGERGISFAEATRVKLSGAVIEKASELRAYTVTEAGELSEAEIKDNEIEADGVSLLVLAGRIEEEAEEEEPSGEEHDEPEVYDNLVETPASNDEPLLQIEELSDETLALLGVERKGTPRPAGKDPSALRKGAGMRSGEGETVASDEDGHLPWESDTMAIEVLKIAWVPTYYGQVVDPVHMDFAGGSDNYIDIKFQIDLSTSGSEVIQPGALEIVIPAYLWKTRPERDESGAIITEGKEPGTIALSVPEEPEHGADFAWRRVGDKIIITNTHMMKGTTRALIQGSFRGIIPHEMEDGTDSREYTNFNVEANLSLESGRTITRTGNMSIKEAASGESVEDYEFTPIYATIDTYAALSSVSKNARRAQATNEYNVYHTVPSNLPYELIPENSENYSYVRWVISATAYGNQPFLMTFTDTLPDEDYNTYRGRILGAEALISTYNDGLTVKRADEDGRSVSGVLYDGYNIYSKTAIVWVAYPKEIFEEGVTYTVSNSVDAEVEGWDEWLGKTREGIDDNLVKTKTATGTASLRLPITYHVTKIWDDNNNEKGRRPSSQSVSIYRDGKYWANASLSDSNSWEYTWDDGGQPHTYRVSEEYLSYGSSSVDDMDREERLITFWHYSQEKLEWDEPTKTWTFTNKYNERKEVIGRVPWIIPGTRSVTERGIQRIPTTGRIRAMTECLTSFAEAKRRISATAYRVPDTSWPIPLIPHSVRETS